MPYLIQEPGCVLAHLKYDVLNLRYLSLHSTGDGPGSTPDLIPCPSSLLTMVTLVESFTYPVKLPNRGIMNGSRLNRRSVVQSPQPQIVSVVALTPHGMFSFEI